MSDSFFGFATEMPSKVNTLGSGKFDEELLTADVEEEYDALNDETFGIGAVEGDWEEDHEKLAQLIDKEVKPQVTSLLDDSVLDGEDSQHEIVEKSISQLGLEDDLDDPAIMTVGRTRHHSRPLESIYGHSPPPPAILDSELCGSPKTHSIWSATHSSTPSKDSGIGSLLQSLTVNTNSSSYQSPTTPLPSLSGDVFNSPSLQPKAWTLEELERDFHSTSSKSVNHPSDEEWSPHAFHLEQLEKRLLKDTVVGTSSHSSQKGLPVASLPQFSQEKWVSVSHGNNKELSTHVSSGKRKWLNATPPLPVSGGVRTLDDVEKDILLKPRAQMVDEVERHLQCSSEDTIRATGIRTPSGSSQIHQGIPSSIVTTSNMSSVGVVQSPTISGVSLSGRTSPVSLPSVQLLGSHIPSPRLPPHPILNPHSAVNSFPGMINNVARNRLPFHMQGQPPPPPGFSPRNPNITQPVDFTNLRHLLYSRQIPHPFLQKQQQLKPPQATRNFNKRFDFDYKKTVLDGPDDEYAGLMTHREKEWLIRIQLLLLHTDNPYVEDYYYTTYSTRKFVQEKTKYTPNGEGDGPKLLLPERSKPETKTYVPTQFEGSLGKLQVVSVNFPRKVLDITVSRPLEDDEGRVVTNQSLLKYRRLLLDIEKMYAFLLEIDDEEKRILALPDEAQLPHKESCSKLAEKIISGLSCSTVGQDDSFQHIMTVRKGRNLGFRALKVFNREQQLCFLAALFRCLAVILRKDQNDMILIQNSEAVTSIIKKATLRELVNLGESLENLPAPESVIVTSPVREKSNFIAAFKSKFGSSVVCCLIQQAENLYARECVFDSEMQARWAKVVLHAVDILCALPDSSVVSPSHPCIDLLLHFQRFAVDRDKFEVLKKKVQIFQFDPCGGGDTVV